MEGLVSTLQPAEAPKTWEEMALHRVQWRQFVESASDQVEKKRTFREEDSEEEGNRRSCIPREGTFTTDFHLPNMPIKDVP